MTPPTFELNVSVPRDARLVEMVRELAVQAAQSAGCGEPEARAFGRTVEAIIREHLEGRTPGTPLPVVVRRIDGPVEVVVDGRCVTIEV